jgi:hydrogenase nickel incorporation protein HypB
MTSMQDREAHGGDRIHSHGHTHEHDHHHGHGTTGLRESRGPGAPGPLGGVHAPATDGARIIQIERDILAENNRYAAANRGLFRRRGVIALNLMSGPGSGKTTLLVRTIADLNGRHPVCVIEGDQQTSFDADRIRATGVAAVQINTGKGCHLDAHMVGHAVERLGPPPGSVLFIENVGNLVCPAGFDLGEAARVVMLSVTEGDDKPLKYPDMFAAADVLVLTKVDLLPHVTFDVDRCFGFARRVNPKVRLLPVSAVSGQGLDAWLAWIEGLRADAFATEATAP